MKAVTLSEIKNIAEYEAIRQDFRSRVIAEKERRRLTVGAVFTFLFENHLTVLYQVQEMIRTERIVKEAAIQFEIETYNELIPESGSLGATLLIEFTDPEERAVELVRLVGIENHIKLVVGALPPIPGRLDDRQMNDKKISSVQYILFPLGDGHLREWKAAGEAGKIRIEVDHPHYTHQMTMPPTMVEALAGDLGL